jgi:predicted DCC family thiol-disulfide oxidoreductase YuxK
MTTSPPPSITTERHPLALFFDGECCFCNRWVSRLMKADTTRRTRFGAKQGATFQRFAGTHPVAADVASIVLVQRDASGEEHVLTHSAAVRAAIDGLPAYALASAILRLTPRPLAELGYAIFSRNRKLIFGSQNICDIVKPADRELFLD